MIKRLKKIMLWLALTLSSGLVILIVLLTTPSLLYAHHTSIGTITVYHNQSLPVELEATIKSALKKVSNSEIYDPHMNTALCLNDGSKYPALVKTVLGSDVFAAFANKVVVLGGYIGDGKFKQWEQILSFDQFLAHGLMHNYQYRHHGFFGANPLGNHAQWKWEGYVDYQVIGKSYDLGYLLRTLESNKNDYDWISLEGGESTIKVHLKFLSLVKYALESKGWSYTDLMESEVSMESLEQEMLATLK